MLLLASALAAWLGFALLALGQARHAEAAARAAPRPRPVAAAALLALGLALAVLREGWGFGLLLFATLVTLAALAVVATLTWRPRWLKPLLAAPAARPRRGRTDPPPPVPTDNRRPAMTARRTLRAAALLLGLGAAGGGAAQAHYLWLERDGDGPGRAYFGYYERDLRERTGGHLDLIAAPQAALGGAPVVAVARREDFIELPPTPGTRGDLRLSDESLAPREDARAGAGRTRTVMHARAGRSEPRAALPLEFVPVSEGEGDQVVLLFRGQPVPRATVTLVGPPRWTKALRTDEAGRVALNLPWAGRYVLQATHTDETPGGAGEGAYARVRHVTSLSFVAERGQPWPPR